MIKALGGSGYEQAMAQIGLGTIGGDKLANQDGKLGGEVNPLATPPSGSSSNSALDAFNDLTNKDKDFWDQN